MKSKKIADKISSISMKAIFILSALWLLLVGIGSMIITPEFVHGEHGLALAESFRISTVVSGGFISVILSLIFGAICIIASLVVYRAIKNLKPWVCLLIVLGYAAIFQVIWLISLDAETFVYPDTLNLIGGAQAFLNGDISSFATHDDVTLDTSFGQYFSWYPFQAGGMLYFALIEWLFPGNYILAFQLVSALANLIIIWMLYLITGLLFKSERYQVMLCLLVAGCLPLFYSSAFVYTNCTGFCLAAVSMYFLIRFIKEDGKARWIYFTLSFIFIGIAMVVKNTFILFALGYVIVLVIYSLQRRRILALILGIVALLIVNSFPNLAVAYVESAMNTDFGEGMPRSAWIAIGLDAQKFEHKPGWWTALALENYTKANGNFAEQEALADASIEASMHEFLSDPVFAAKFFALKVGSEWLDPTYQTLFYSSEGTHEDLIVNENPLVWSTLYDGYPLHEALILIMDAYQWSFYLLSAAAFWILFRKKRRLNSSLSLIPVILLIGVAVYALWEAKSVYILPYFIILLPFASYGLCNLRHIIKKNLSVKHFKHNKSVSRAA